MVHVMVLLKKYGCSKVKITKDGGDVKVNVINCYNTAVLCNPGLD